MMTTPFVEVLSFIVAHGQEFVNKEWPGFFHRQNISVE